MDSTACNTPAVSGREGSVEIRVYAAAFLTIQKQNGTKCNECYELEQRVAVCASFDLSHDVALWFSLSLSLSLSLDRS